MPFIWPRDLICIRAINSDAKSLPLHRIPNIGDACLLGRPSAVDAWKTSYGKSLPKGWWLVVWQLKGFIMLLFFQVIALA